MRNALLTVAYVLLVIPAGLVLRVLRDPMRRSRSRRRQSYWHREVTRG
ncbi:hypothetical protein AB0C40_22255 [Streptomyces brevispora]|uniref:Uncharacterized protein n=1 Tax=Streptomyces brevispora TaxID=887462 RepID=A0ABZ1FY77_9ACTN|nr:hypothetical protein [Streptomyces brevispora]WSC11983.1 hypothetical protein OIE64_03380 [Streptomyces brevispora]